MRIGMKISRRGGYTLIELMVTIALATTLLGLGVSALLTGGRSSVYRQTLSDVAGLVNKCRNASSHLPASLVVDPQGGQIYAMTERPLQELHFEPKPRIEGDGTSEDQLDVAMGINGFTVVESTGTVVQGGGYVGGGLRLDGGVVNCGNYPSYDVTDGLSLEIWVKADDRPKGLIISKGKAFQVRFEGRNGLKVDLMVDDQGGAEIVSREVKLPFEFRAGQWLGVGVSYDRASIVVTTDHGHGPVERDRVAESRALRPDPDEPLVIGNPAFVGFVDDFRMGGVHLDQPVRMPKDITLDGDLRTIRFLRGQLDPNLHAGVVPITVRSGERITTFEIGQNGVIQNVNQEGEPTAARAVEGERPAQGTGKTE